MYKPVSTYTCTCDLYYIIITYPEPLPPTIAIFFPAGTRNDNPSRISLSGT